MPRYEFAGFDRYRQLFANDVWWTSAANLGWFGIPFIAICVGLGLFLAILLDQKIRNEGALRAIFLYPMALSFIVTGTAWQWILNPGLGLEKVFHDWGWTSFSFDWLGNPGQGDLLRRDRGRVAIDRLRHGALPRRPARRRQRKSSRRRRWTARACRPSTARS